MDLQLRGKKALVCGGSAGIGFAIAEALLEEGAEVVIASRNPKHVEATVDQFRPQFGDKNVSGVVFDTASESAVREGFASASRQRPIELLVNNTGGPAHGAALSIPLEQWDLGYHSLLRSVVLLSQLAVPAMRELRFGRILTITSTSAKEHLPGLPVSSVFRSALTAWTKELAKEVGEFGILANNLLPGPIATSRMAQLAAAQPQMVQDMESRTAVRRSGTPQELGRIAAFLLSPANGFTTGTDIVVDGGATRALH